MQSNTDRSCLLIPFTSAPNTGQDRNQVFPDAGHVDYLTIGAKKSMHYIANNEDISDWWKLVQTRPYISSVSFDKTSARPLHLVQVLALPPDDITRWLKKPEFDLSTMITMRVEMTPLITQESHSGYEHTSISTHSNSTTTTIPWLCPPTSSKIVIVNFISQDACVLQYRHACENSFRIEKCLHHRIWPRQSIKKRGSIVFASDRKWEVMGERAIGEGETLFSVVQLPFLIWNHCCGRRNHRMACRRNHVTNRVVFII